MLSQNQIEEFKAEGFLVVENIISDDLLEAIKAEYKTLMDQLYETWQKKGWVKPLNKEAGFWEKLDQAYIATDFDWYQPLDISLPHDDITLNTPFHIGPSVFNMMTNKRLLDVVEAILGSELTSNPIQHIRIKPPQRLIKKDELRAHITKTDWHQDRGVTLASADQTEMLTVWLAITDTTEENGCLQVLPLDEQKLITHCAFKGAQVGIPEALINKSNVKNLPVKAGGVVLLHPLIPHASLSNTSDDYRWSFDLRFNVTGQPTGRDHFPSFIARSRKNPSHEEKDWRRYLSAWEKTRYDCATGPHVNQHGRWDNSSHYCA